MWLRAYHCDERVATQRATGFLREPLQQAGGVILATATAAQRDAVECAKCVMIAFTRIGRCFGTRFESRFGRLGDALCTQPGRAAWRLRRLWCLWQHGCLGQRLVTDGAQVSHRLAVYFAQGMEPDALVCDATLEFAISDYNWWQTRHHKREWQTRIQHGTAADRPAMLEHQQRHATQLCQAELGDVMTKGTPLPGLRGTLTLRISDGTQVCYKLEQTVTCSLEEIRETGEEEKSGSQ